MITTAQPAFLNKKLFLNVTTATLFLLAIMALSFGLHMYNIQSIGDANAYYTAAVKAMLQSWSNFFFVAAEPGGSVTVDKPPLGLWIEATFAYFLGVSGFSVSLPNILAGVFGIPVLYHLVKKYMGELAGLIAALVMAFTPVYVATNRNNTMDGLLVFFLLLAAWAFIKATESGKLRWVLLGALIVGLGFNIKMLQAFLPLPAFYALYFLGSKEGWLRKIFNLSMATLLLVAVSLSWALVVDSIPSDQRPFIGSSQDNTVMSLITGHNGTSRIFGGFFGGGQNQPDGQDAAQSQTPPTQPQLDQPLNPSSQPQQGQRLGPPPQALAACADQSQGSSCSFTTPNGNVIHGSCIVPPNSTDLACAPQGMIPQNGQPPAGSPNNLSGTQFSQETGSPGAFRFFTQPLSKQMSWLLPFASISIVLALFAAKIKLPLESDTHKAMVLWGGWLLTCVIFFSAISGIFHAYYAIMLVPALGAVVAIGFSQFWDWAGEKPWSGTILILAAGITIGFQIFAMNQYGETTNWLYVAGILLFAGSVMVFFSRKLAYLTILTAMMIIPAYWTVMTTVSNANQNLPTAYSGGNGQAFLARAFAQGDGGRGSNVNNELLLYLQENTQDVEYLVAVPSSQQGSTLVLATGRPVLFMGGFGGQDDVVNADDLAQLVANGELRYVLYGGDRGNKQDIANWLQTSCEVVPEFTSVNSGNPPQAVNQPIRQDQPQGPDGGGQSSTLYECR